MSINTISNNTLGAMTNATTAGVIKYRSTSFGMHKSVNDFIYDKSYQNLHSQIKVPDAYKTEKIQIEDDIITTWRNLAKEALEGQHKESDLSCWDGHYDQFGMTMLFLSRLAYSRKSSYGMNDQFIDKFIYNHKYFLDGFWEAPSSEERMWYREWFAAIHHPDFPATSINDIEGITSSVIALNIMIAKQEFSYSLH